jgi:hypothetical protein
MSLREKNTEAYQRYLIHALCAEVASKEAEVQAVRRSLRYRIGEFAIEAWPPSYRTLAIIVRISYALLRRKVRNLDIRLNDKASIPQFPLNGCRSSILVFGCQAPSTLENGDVFSQSDPGSLSYVLDSGRAPGTLVIRIVDQAIVRRISRLRLEGWKVVWLPENECDERDAALVAYLKTHVDDCADFSVS